MGRIHSILYELGLSPFLSFLITSQEAASSKPESGIFLKAIAKAGIQDLQCEEILHIGDDYNKDYVGARTLGWQAQLVDREGSEEREHHTVRDVREIFDKYQFVSS